MDDFSNPKPASPHFDSGKAEKNVLFKCATGKKTSERVEDKLVILEALEKNLVDYNKLRDQFVEIFEEIKQLNDPTTTSKFTSELLISSPWLFYVSYDIKHF